VHDRHAKLRRLFEFEVHAPRLGAGRRTPDGDVIQGRTQSRNIRQSIRLRDVRGFTPMAEKSDEFLARHTKD
jgi:hypothetical protein